jgi:hypothetical protein
MEKPTKFRKLDEESLENLPLEIIVKMLSENPEISVDDIQAMARTSTRFREIVDSGMIWRAIFRRQFGSQEFNRMTRKYPFPSLMILLMVRRFIEYSRLYINERWRQVAHWFSHKTLRTDCVLYVSFEKIEVLCQAPPGFNSAIFNDFIIEVVKLPYHYSITSRAQETDRFRIEILAFTDELFEKLCIILFTHFKLNDRYAKEGVYLGSCICSKPAQFREDGPDGKLFCSEQCQRVFYQ